MARPHDYVLSAHAVDRMMERGGKIAATIRKSTSTTERREAVHKLLCDGVENRSFLNDTKFMTGIYEKYGYDRKYVAFLAHGFIFLGVDNGQTRTIVTILPQDEHRVHHFRPNKRFGK